MSYPSLLLRVSTATLVLVLCLHLEIIGAQEYVRKAILFNLNVPRTATTEEEITVKLQVETELTECMVVKAYLKSTDKIEGAFNYVQTRCLCNDDPATFYWDFFSNKTVVITAVLDIIREKGICPDDLAVVPIDANRYHASRIIYVNRGN